MKVGLLVDINKNFREQIAYAKALGFDRGQLVVWDMDFYTEENAVALKAALDELGFAATDMWCGWSGPVDWKHPGKYASLGLVPKEYRARRLEDLKRGARFAHSVGIKNIISHTGFIPDDPAAEARLGVVAALRELCTELLERGQSFSFETGEELPLTLAMVITEIGLPNVGVNFDPANLLSGGRGNPNDAMDLLGEHILGMHAKDAIPAKFGEPNGKQVQIGEGKVDFERLLRQLKKYGYEGDIVIEHEMSGRADRGADILRAKAYLETLVNKVFGE